MYGFLNRRWPSALAAVWVLSASAAAQPGDAAPPGFFSTPSNASARMAWHIAKRAFPRDTMEQGYLLKAIRTLAAPSGSAGPELTWTEAGPRPGTLDSYGRIAGRVTALAVHPENPAVVWAGAAGGGVWSSTDGGRTWLPRTDHLASLASGALALDPSDPRVVFWGTGEPSYAADALGGAGVFLSTDGGEVWSPAGLEQEKRVTALAVDPADGRRVVAATWGGIYRTTNRGGSWSRSLAAGYGYAVTIDPVTPTRMFAGIGDNATAAGVYRSTDGGSSWERLLVGLPDPHRINRVALALAPTAPSTVYALMSARAPFGALLGLYRTTNGGTSWQEISTVPADLFGASRQGWYDMTVTVHPTRPSTVFIGGIHLYRTTNGGSGWTNVSGLTLHPDQHALAFGGEMLYAANDGGVWSTSSNGSAWTNLNERLAVTQFYSVAADRQTSGQLFGGTQDNGTQRTTGPVAWTGVLGGDGGMTVVDPGSSARVFAQTQYGGIHRSTDGGASFAHVYDVGGAWLTPLRLDPVDPRVLYSASTRVLRSTNGGDGWETISPPLNGGTNIQWLTLDPSAPGTIYAASNQKIFRTTSGGGAWRLVSAGLPDRFVEQVVTDPSDPATVYAVFSGVGAAHVYVSTNRGDAWREVATGLADVPATALAVSPYDRNMLFLGTDLGLWVSTDRGASWLKETGLPNAAVADMTVTGDGRLVVATHGRSMFSTTLNSGFRVLAPREGEIISPGRPTLLRWTGHTPGGEVRIELLRPGAAQPEVIADRTLNDGTEVWHVPAQTGAGLRIRVSSPGDPTTGHTGGTFGVAEPVRFLAVMTVTNSAGQTDTLEFGSAGGATPGIDPVYGERELPPKPPSAMFDVRWLISGTQGVRRDVRQEPGGAGRRHVLAAGIQSGRGGFPVTFRWNPFALPPGRLVLRDAYTGGGLFSVDMRRADSLLLTNPAHAVVELVYAATDTVTVVQEPGWNLLSLPVDAADPSVRALVPTAESRAFTHTVLGYAGTDTLVAGRGYWLKLAAPGPPLVGVGRTADTIAVHAGWNLVGSVAGRVPVEEVRTVPPGILVSPFLGRDGPVSWIEPGKAYWVKAGGEGVVIMVVHP